jgi:hypothetical protein
MPLRSSLLAAGLGVLVLVLAGCGSQNKALIPQDDADRLTELVGSAGDASAAGECARARRAVAEAELQLSALPRKTSKRLKANLKGWLDHLDSQIERECKTAAPEASPTETPTETPEPTETPTAESPTATPSPTATATPAPTETADPGTGGQGSPTEPQGTGGVSPGDG